MNNGEQVTTSPSERLVKNIRRATCKHYSSEEKIRVVLDGLRGGSSIAELCRREGTPRGFTRNTPQKVVWRAQIVLLAGNGLRAVAIAAKPDPPNPADRMSAVQPSEACVG